MFQRAKRKTGPVSVCIMGESGSGKTITALALAQGLGRRIALVDAEGGQAACYAEHYAYDMVVLKPPYCPSRFAAAVHAAELQQYDVVVLDGLSLAWSGSGGILDQVDAARAAGVPEPWTKPGALHQEMLRAIQNAGCHIVVTLREKPVWEQMVERLSNGREVRRLVKTGVRPEQRSDIGYAFAVFLRMRGAMRAARVWKDGTGVFTDKEVVVTPDHGRALHDWANGVQCLQSGLDRAMRDIAACSSLNELARLWGNWPQALRDAPWQAAINSAVVRRLRELRHAEGA